MAAYSKSLHPGSHLCAGWDTSAHTIAFTCGLIATHPEAEAKIAAELDALGLLVTPERQTPRQISQDDLTRLPFTNAVIKVVLRHATSWSGVSRVCNTTTKVESSAGKSSGTLHEI